MGRGKSEASRRERQGKTSDGNLKVKGENFYRTAKDVKRLKIFKEGKPQRDAKGNITKDASYQSRDVPQARIEPNRKWFHNTRVISQESLTAFRNAVEQQASDPYKVLLKGNKLPMSLIRDGTTQSTNGVKIHQAKMMIETAPFSNVLKRKRVTIGSSTLTDLASEAEKSMGAFETKAINAKADGVAAGENSEEEPALTEAKEAVFSKGQSRRIWNELYRTIDSSDVLLMILDARDPLGTRCRSVEEYLRKEAPHKHLCFILNKCDLVPNNVAARWVKFLSKTAPTCAFRASVKNPFGRGQLISLLRQFASLHSDRKQIACGIIGYPNTGKSSLINTLRGKKTCNTAPIPGETKVWQYVTLTRKIYLIDCPGIVPPENVSAVDILLRGAVRTEKVDNPWMYIPDIIARVKRHHLARSYEIEDWRDSAHLIEQLARKRGRLLPGGEPDETAVARIMIDDFLRGRIPWYTPPPAAEGEEGDEIEGRAGRLGEMPRKRKREEEDDSVVSKSEATVETVPGGKAEKGRVDGGSEDDFEGFGSESGPDSNIDGTTEDGGTGVGDDTDDMISLGSSSEDEQVAVSDDDDSEND